MLHLEYAFLPAGAEWGAGVAKDQALAAHTLYACEQPAHCILILQSLQRDVIFGSTCDEWLGISNCCGLVMHNYLSS